MNSMVASALSVPQQEVEILIHCEGGEWQSLADCEALIEQTLSGALACALEQRPAYRGRVWEISVLLTDDAQMQALNRQWRGRDKPTNVLSFPAVDEAMLSLESTGDRWPLGDLALAWETVAREAETQAKPLSHHLRHLLVHGLLHLLGYDHEEAQEAEDMERFEALILAGWDIPNPYDFCN